MISKIIGIDVSHHQGKINWFEVAKENIKFAIIRSNDGTFLDRTFEYNIRGAFDQDLIIGTYFYFRFRNKLNDVLKQVDIACEKLMKTLSIDGVIRTGVLPLSLDVECNNKLTLSEDVKTRQLLISLERIKELTGLSPFLYTFPSYWNTNFPNTSSQFEKYKLWIAHVGVKTPRKTGTWTDHVIHQYSHTGKINGIKGNVDLNYYNGDESDLRWMARSLKF